ncbi:MAG: MgtC/SapB family protein [Faecousia sp.]
MAACLRDFNFMSVALRLTLAVVCGGVIGLEREAKRRAAGFRTYMLVALGSTLAMLLGQYVCRMLQGPWAVQVDSRVDVSRIGAQVVNGIGFLGAGTVIVNTGKQQVKGLTTAAGLWACGCMGLAIGAGFYECVILSVLLVFLSMRALWHMEGRIVDNSRNINLYIEFSSIDDTSRILRALKAHGAQIYEVDIGHEQLEPFQNPSAVISLRLKEKLPHTQLIASMMDLECIRSIEEI